MTLQEAMEQWHADSAQFAARGVVLPDVKGYLPESFKTDYAMALDEAGPALDAQIQLSGTSPNSAVPTMLTTFIDPQVFKVLFSPTKAAEIFTEQRKGDWTLQTTMFPTVEHTGEVTSYGDFNENGSSGVNTNWPQRQSYLFQTMKEYGDLELDRAGLAKISWAAEVDASAANSLNRFSNLTYFFGVTGLQNYGLLNDPNLSASLTPITLATGGTAWIQSGVVKAQANEIYSDIESLFIQLVAQTGGLVEAEDEIILAMSPASAAALTATNTFNVNVNTLLKHNFPNIKIMTAVQYGVISATNPYGIAAGNLVQMFVRSIEGQATGYCAFNEKMRAHPIVRETSSYKQKVTAGTWGAVIRMPMAIASMVGV